jgi:hypothetical protein
VQRCGRHCLSASLIDAHEESLRNDYNLLLASGAINEIWQLLVPAARNGKQYETKLWMMKKRCCGWWTHINY